MKRKIMFIFIALIIVLVGFWVLVNKNRKGTENTKETENIKEVTEISLGEEAWINSYTKIKIKDTNDYFEITEKVKWEVPEHPEGTTISFSIPVPYTFVVNGVSYNGIYELNESDGNKKAEGLEYNLSVVNLTKDGKIKVEVTK